MDFRYILAGLALLVASFAVHALHWSKQTWAFGIPFAVILLFLGIIGESPMQRIKHLVPDRE